jgi:hypothetical protein
MHPCEARRLRGRLRESANQEEIMRIDDLLCAVLAPAQSHRSQDMLLAFLREGYAAAEAVADATDRQRAHKAHLLQSMQVLNALTTAQVHPCATVLQAGALSLLWEIRYRYRHRVTRHDYRDEHCGAYPFRDAAKRPVRVLSAEPSSARSQLGRRCAYAEVEPFVRPGMSQRQRAFLYRSRLRVRRITAADLRSPGERDLIGQRGVFAAAAIPAGVCVGVCGGQVVDEVDIFLIQDDRYLLGASEVPGDTAINCENMMSVVNTLFLLDERGNVVGHPSTGYNVEAACFRARMAGDRELVLHALFSIADIRPGEELRWNYDLGRY